MHYINKKINEKLISTLILKMINLQKKKYIKQILLQYWHNKYRQHIYINVIPSERKNLIAHTKKLYN